MADQTASPSTPSETGFNLLQLVATALVRLSRRSVPASPVYDDAVQSAYNQLVLHCLRRGDAAPMSIAEMVRWAAERPLEGWPIDLPDDLATPEAYLVDGKTRTPTQQCLEWAIAARDAAAEQFENELMIGVIGECRTAQAPQSYTAFRRLLITRPVLTGTDLALLAEDLDLHLLLETIKRAYEPVPAAYLREGRYAECVRCKCLLAPVGSDEYRCELDRCRREHHPKIGRLIDPSVCNGVYQLARPLRMFITGPGLAETDLEAALIARGLPPEMWPNFDAYDLRITLPNNQIWAVDVKDRANPALLGRETRCLPKKPPYHRAFLVAPKYRFEERESYGRIFAHHVPDEIGDKIELLSDSDFLRLVGREVKRIHRNQRQAIAGERGSADA
ncbi:hypothetical protein NDR87_13765 [Nocardia sp. CDC159]|uniref:REase associating with pPIWI RE domain-containing protein n=1 Tax=Nocardia pulmonis TaxID=2951408 RepID=A0A9X2E7Y0_9NOCA|nr:MULTISPECIES: hypothetical protein [Nocardia]MCM6774510.1 hypothetical protein [Nocardia pulmonis]MCM6787424.1 hypothetical protein [Nocardia sp. CDC159]